MIKIAFSSMQLVKSTKLVVYWPIYLKKKKKKITAYPLGNIWMPFCALEKNKSAKISNGFHEMGLAFRYPMPLQMQGGKWE